MALAKARERGKGAAVTQVLEQRESALRLKGQGKSLPQAAPGLRCWHAFATTFLDYGDLAMIPPELSRVKGSSIMQLAMKRGRDKSRSG